MQRRAWLTLLTALAVGFAGWANAADHADGPQASADPAADITDVFAWMSSDGQRVNMALGIGRNVATSFRFSDHIDYVFHTSSQASYGASVKTEVDVICRFDAGHASGQNLQCWAGNGEYVSGNASNPGGIVSSSGRFRVYAGVRNDPFFFNLTGFKETAAAVAAAAPSLSFDAAGCPALDATTSNALVTQLSTGKAGAPPKNDFNGFNIGAIVVSIDKSLLTAGGPILGVWGATHRR